MAKERGVKKQMVKVGDLEEKELVEGKIVLEMSFHQIFLNINGMRWVIVVRKELEDQILSTPYLQVKI